MKKQLLGGVLLLVSSGAMAQADTIKRKHAMKDSVTMVYLRAAALRYPLLRQASVSTELIGHSAIDSRLYDKDFYKGNVQVARLKANVNIPVWQTSKNTISTSVSYMKQWMELGKGVSYNASLPVTDQQTNKSTSTFLLSYTHNDSLFNKPFLVSVSAAAITNQDFSTLRMNYFGTLGFTLKRTPVTNLIVGVAVILDPSSPVPASPFVSYSHRFTKPKLELYVDIPSRVSLRKELSSRASLAVGSQLGGNLFFFNIDNAFMPKQTIFTTLEIKSGATFEYLLGKHVVLGVSGGALSTLQSRLFEKSVKSNDYFLGNKMGTAPYANVSISVLPFMRGFHKTSP